MVDFKYLILGLCGMARAHLANAMVDELIRTAAMHRRGFGSLFHVINHATALSELSRLGYRKLAKQGMKAHHRHLRLLRSLPELSVELGELKPAKHDPRTKKHWKEADSTQWGAHLTHEEKTVYGFFTLLRLIESKKKRNRAEEKFLYLMG